MAAVTPDMITPEREARFWSKVDRRGADECWPWTGCRNHDGYGAVKIGGRSGTSARSHRVSLMIATGKTGVCAIHSCDNPPCCNPAHLRWGSPAENAADRELRNRTGNRAGRHNGNARLTAAQAADIRSSELPTKVLAARHGISISHAQNIRKGSKWRGL